MLTFLMIAALNLMKLESEPVLYEEFGEVSAEVTAQYIAPYTIIDGNEISEGSVITFGRYEQDGDTSNGAEDIEWRVIKVEDGKATLYPLKTFLYGSYLASDLILKQFCRNAFTDIEQSVMCQAPTLFSEAEYTSFFKVVVSDRYGTYYCPPSWLWCPLAKVAEGNVAGVQLYGAQTRARLTSEGHEFIYQNNSRNYAQNSNTQDMAWFGGTCDRSDGICPYIIINVEG